MLPSSHIMLERMCLLTQFIRCLKTLQHFPGRVVRFTKGLGGAAYGGVCRASRQDVDRWGRRQPEALSL